MVNKKEVAIGKIIPVRVLQKDVDLFILTSVIGQEERMKANVRLSTKIASKIHKVISLKSNISLDVRVN